MGTTPTPTITREIPMSNNPSIVTVMERIADAVGGHEIARLCPVGANSPVMPVIWMRGWMPDAHVTVTPRFHGRHRSVDDIVSIAVTIDLRHREGDPLELLPVLAAYQRAHAMAMLATGIARDHTWTEAEIAAQLVGWGPRCVVCGKPCPHDDRWRVRDQDTVSRLLGHQDGEVHGACGDAVLEGNHV